MQGCDAVIHLAAAADVNEVLADPVEAERRNARGDAARARGRAAHRRAARRLRLDDLGLFGHARRPATTSRSPLHPPAHLYTATKLAGELYCHSYGELYGVEHTILRFGIPYGPRARPAAVVPAFVGRALAGEPLTIAGDGSQSRRFVYVEDLAEGVVRALAPVAANRTYNLVGGEDVTIREIAETVRDVVGDVEIVHGPGRSGDFAGAPVSGERARRELGWRATTPFVEGVRRYVEWHREALAGSRAGRGRAAPGRRASRRGALALGWAARDRGDDHRHRRARPRSTTTSTATTRSSTRCSSLLCRSCSRAGSRGTEPHARRLRDRAVGRPPSPALAVAIAAVAAASVDTSATAMRCCSCSSRSPPACAARLTHRGRRCRRWLGVARASDRRPRAASRSASTSATALACTSCGTR